MMIKNKAPKIDACKLMTDKAILTLDIKFIVALVHN